ncbi:MAG: M61 family metallopeptidase [Myxococcaceae bacterium]
MTVRYEVSLREPHAHLLDLEAHFPAKAEPHTLALPVWTPGSYLVREYARHLQNISASTAGGVPLDVVPLDKHRYRVDGNGEPVRVRYRVYANELTVRTSHFDDSHAYFNGATVFLYDEAFRHRAHHVRIEAPTGWRVFCALPEQSGPAQSGVLVAPDYDTLVDSPIEVGPHTAQAFVAAGVKHTVVFVGDPKPDAARIQNDFTRIIEAQAPMFGGLPFERYLFLIYLVDKGRGGLEHQASTALLYPRFGLGTPRGWEDFLGLVSHEYFHLWNVKRIKPAAFVPFDYSREVHTSLLWAFEGTTSYYDNLFVQRAGLMSPARYLLRLGEALTSLHGTPGRNVQTLSEASFFAWTKHYRPDENTPNSAISYYLKGEVVSLLLDLEIRQRTANARSLDDVMRLLWERYGRTGQGVPENGVEQAAHEVAGTSLAPFFERALRSTESLDYAPFGHVGLDVRFRVRESPQDKGGGPPRLKSTDVRPKGWLGATLKNGVQVATVASDSPAMRAGLYADDDIVALDGYKVDGAQLLSRIDDKRPGDVVRLSVFRKDRLVELPVTLGAKPADAVYLARVDNPSPAQKAAYHAWLGQAWETAE